MVRRNACLVVFSLYFRIWAKTPCMPSTRRTHSIGLSGRRDGALLLRRSTLLCLPSLCAGTSSSVRTNCAGELLAEWRKSPSSVSETSGRPLWTSRCIEGLRAQFLPKPAHVEHGRRRFPFDASSLMVVETWIIRCTHALHARPHTRLLMRAA